MIKNNNNKTRKTQTQNTTLKLQYLNNFFKCIKKKKKLKLNTVKTHFP